MGKIVAYISIVLIFSLVPDSFAIYYSDTHEGIGSIKKEYYISDIANDYVKVCIDIKNATYFNYTYMNYSDEVQCSADMELTIKNAESVRYSCSAKSGYNISTNSSVFIKRGDITYGSLIVSSAPGVRVSQNIIEADADSIGAVIRAQENNSKIMENNISAIYIERLISNQEMSFGLDILTNTSIGAIAGPIKAILSLEGADYEFNTTADIVAGIIQIDQIINQTVAHQESKGVIGGANFKTMVKSPKGNTTDIYTTTGSGYLIDLSQNASEKGSSYKIEYGYKPVSYQNGTYDILHAEAGSDIFSSKDLTNRIIADHCEHLLAGYEADLDKNTSANTSINALAGPIKAISSLEGAECEFNTTADIVAGEVYIGQAINLTEAHQESKGVTGGANFKTAIKSPKGNTTDIYTTTGSGNLIDLSQSASEKGSSYKFEYEYMPTSYQKGTYDLGSAHAYDNSILQHNYSISNIVLSFNCEHLMVEHEADWDKNALVNTDVNAISGPLRAVSSIEEGDRMRRTIAEVVAGVIHIDQIINSTEAHQESKGVTGGVNFDTMVKNNGTVNPQIRAITGSGSLVNLLQHISGTDTSYKLEYEYMPVSYENGFYDLNSKLIHRKI